MKGILETGHTDIVSAKISDKNSIKLSGYAKVIVECVMNGEYLYVNTYIYVCTAINKYIKSRNFRAINLQVI